MTVDIRYDGEKDYVSIALNGVVTPEQVRAAITEIAESHEIPKGAGELWDIRGSKGGPRYGYEVMEHLTEFQEHFKAQRGHPKVALLVDTDVAYGVGRMAQTLTEVTDPEIADIQIFRDSDDALAWLSQKKG